MRKHFVLLLSDEAYLDILSAHVWYGALLKKLGNEFEKSVDQELQRITANPELFQIKYKNIRVAYLEKFPYGIHYFVEETTIKVVAVFHTSLNPESWDDRI